MCIIAISSMKVLLANILIWHWMSASCLWSQESKPKRALWGQSQTVLSSPVQLISKICSGQWLSAKEESLTANAPVYTNKIVKSCDKFFAPLFIVFVCLYIAIPYSEYPSCLQTTLASMLSQKWSQIVPQVPLTQTSTLPELISSLVLLTSRLTSWMAPLVHLSVKGRVFFIGAHGNKKLSSDNW